MIGVLAQGVWVEPPSALEPAGPAAARIAQLWWVLLAAAVAVYALTMALLLLALRSRRRGSIPLGANRFILLFGAAIPSVVLVGVFALTLQVGATVTQDEGQLEIAVIGEQFWWEVRYAEAGVVTANEVHIPVGVPVELVLTSDDVIHSFWVPQLSGKMDLIPGRTTTLVLQADRAGVFGGECAEYCGIQHARMRLLVVAQPPDEFEAWLAAQALPAAEPDTALEREGREVFLASSCVHCHRIAGVSESTLGPDLTHLGSRRTIGAALMENDTGHLGGWILDPQALKRGVRMPPTSLRGPQLRALLAYLESLE